MSIDPEDRRALYQRVVDELRAEITSGTLAPGSRVPSANQLTERFDISGMTAQRALRELRHQGLIYGIHGKGTYVHPEALERIKAAEQPNESRPRLPRTQADAFWAELATIAQRGQDATTDAERLQARQQISEYLAANEDKMTDRTPLTAEEQLMFVIRVQGDSEVTDDDSDA